MVATTSAMDRKVRRTLVLVGVLLLVPVIWAVRNYMASISESKVVADSTPTDERLVVVDGDTMIVAPSAIGQTMTAWLHSPKAKTITFELSDRSFQANSAAPTPITVTRVAQVASLTRASPTIHVHILEPAGSTSSAIHSLYEQRAMRLQHDLVARGVDGSRVAIESEQEQLPAIDGPHLALLLTK
jgi:hypothetical protein